ncbi:MAG: hypothetical protein HYX37_14380 [Rhizobiales bacterium]|nr:hypothetical protein [Hyphomicrobiales bacterium]
MPSRRDKIGLWKLVLAIWLAALLQTFAQPVLAEVRVSGPADAVIVETREASVEEVLAALGASFNLHYRTSGALNRVLTGTYTGSLQRVIARLLEGHNYVMQSSAGGGELIVVGTGVAGSGVSASRRQVVADARQPELPAPPRASDVQGWDATTQVGQPIAPPLPNANGATLAVPRASPSSLSVPVPPSDNSVIGPPHAIAVPGLVPPLPESVPQHQPPGLQGWNG